MTAAQVQQSVVNMLTVGSKRGLSPDRSNYKNTECVKKRYHQDGKGHCRYRNNIMKVPFGAINFNKIHSHYCDQKTDGQFPRMVIISATIIISS